MPTSDRQSEDTRRAGWLKLSLLGWVVHVAFAAGLFARVFVTGPEYQRTFQEYQIAVPGVTHLVLGASRAMPQAEAPFWLLGGLALFDLVVLVGLARRGDWVAWHGWFWGVLVLLLLLFVAVEYALRYPMWKLRQALPGVRF